MGRAAGREGESQRIDASGLEDGGRGQEPHYRWTVEIEKLGNRFFPRAPTKNKNLDVKTSAFLDSNKIHMNCLKSPSL